MAKETRPGEKEQLFLERWRALEKALTENGSMQVLDLEKGLEQDRPSDAGRLRICRQIRNFIVHDSPGFVGVTGAMLEFVAQMEYEAARAGGTAKDACITPAAYGCVKASDTVKKAASVLYNKRRGDVIVTDQKGTFLGLLGARSLAAILASPDTSWTLERLAAKKLLITGGVPYCLPDDPLAGTPACRCLVLDRDKRCIGVMNPQAAWGGDA